VHQWGKKALESRAYRRRSLAGGIDTGILSPDENVGYAHTALGRKKAGMSGQTLSISVRQGRTSLGSTIEDAGGRGVK